LLLTLVVADSVMACLLPEVQMSAAEHACCKHMAKDCGNASMTAKTSLLPARNHLRSLRNRAGKVKISNRPARDRAGCSVAGICGLRLFDRCQWPNRFGFVAGDSPPGSVPLFLAHSTLLI